MGVKIKSILLNGVRGVKESLQLDLEEKSILLYGDNGSGKSSISDSIEWFYTDKVSHLSGSEIDLKDALRNSHLTNTQPSIVQLIYNKSNLNTTKQLSKYNDKLKSETTSASEDFKEYYSNSENENLLLRYEVLRDFVDQTKGDKLKQLSDIIGFIEVTKTKDILKKSFSSIKLRLRNQNYDGQITTQKQILVDKIGAIISQEKNLFEKINEVILPLNLGVQVNSITDIDSFLTQIKKPVNSKQIHELKFLEDTNAILTDLKNEIIFIDSEYQKYFNEFILIANDVKSIMQIFLSELLKTGDTVIEKKYHKDESCPLCLQSKNIEDLRSEIKKRLKDIEASSKKKSSFDTSKKNIEDIASIRLKRIDLILGNELINNSENSSIKEQISKLRLKFVEYQSSARVKVTSGKSLPDNGALILKESDFVIQELISKRIGDLKKSIKKSNFTVIYSNVSASKDAFLRIKLFENEKSKLEYQKNSLELIYNEFVKRQKEGLESFIDTFSGYINEFYQYMNPGEQFEEIRIVTIGEEDQLNGLTIEYKYNKEWVSPPQKYFSESHLNCFGIAYFLASVKAFNKINKFIFFDDVISSFDSNHRQRFANLLFEKFNDYQIVLLTHESEWFSYVKQLAKNKNWLIKEIKWNDLKGTSIDPNYFELKDFIENELSNGSIHTLGNPIRTYLEGLLKEICAHLEVKVSFKFNDLNEKRMSNELLSSLRSKINKSGGQDLKSKIPIIERVENSTILGNLLSHDNPFDPKLGDLKAFWVDIMEMKKIFICEESTCKRPNVSINNYDNVAKKIRCGCDMVKYDWKE